jgi:redox-sensitive bicupin YhaK (pirin superfamily)
MTPPPHFTSMPTVRRIAEVFTAHDTIEGDGVRTMLLFSGGDEVHVQSSGEGVRFLFFSGKPIQEPIAWGGPIVMNTQEELRLAFSEYRDGAFIRTKA